MNKKNKANPTAQLALLIATMVVIEVLSQTIFAAFALPIKPTLTHIPVIIASIVYGPKIGAYLGGFMGIMSIVRNTIVYISRQLSLQSFCGRRNLGICCHCNCSSYFNRYFSLLYLQVTSKSPRLDAVWCFRCFYKYIFRASRYLLPNP